MKTHLPRSLLTPAVLGVLWSFNLQLATLRAQGTAFTYQGHLNDGGNPAQGLYDIQAGLFTTNAGGTVFAGPITNTAVTVSNGLFVVRLDYGNVFNGTAYWLQLSVRTNGVGTFTDLTPRQELTPGPYSIFAESANAAGLSGTIPSAAFTGSYTNPVTFNNGSDQFNGNFSGQFFGSLFMGGTFNGTHFGDGSGLSNLNPAQFSGPIPGTFLVNAWKTTGNSGTTPGLNFLGTSDNQPLELRVNGQRALQLLPDNSTNQAPDIVGGSLSNAITGELAGTIISGGAWNTIGPDSPFSTNNPYGDLGAYPSLGASYSTISGGFLNQIQAGATFSTVAGGGLNTIGSGDVQSTIGGGFGNTVATNASWSVIAGGTHHTIGSINGFIGGGWDNLIQTNSGYSAIVGGLFNNIRGASSQAFIGGGQANVIGPDGFGGGGGGSAIGGGYANGIYEFDSFIGGGQQNLIAPYSDHSVIGGGYSNVVSGSFGPAYGVIGGGQGNVIQTNTSYAVIGGGYGNMIQSNALYGVVPGGYNNLAGGSGSFAAGERAQATNSGTFVWSDSAVTNAFNSTGSNQFLIRASGGVGIGTNNPAAALHVVGGGGSSIALRVANGGIAVSGAGIGSATAAFIQLTSAANVGGDSTFINNPLCNGDPHALLFVTHCYNPPNGTTATYFNKSVGVWYTGTQWAIYTEDTSPMLTNIAFNVLVIKP